MNITLPEKFQNIFTTPARYRVWYGGRGSSKSHSIARALLIIGMQKTTRVLCCREFQASIADSSYRLLVDLIHQYELESFYTITKTEIRGENGTLFIFRGIKIDPHGIKSLEGVQIAWVEESEKISEESLDILIPTIRLPGSEIWLSFNPHRPTDPVYQRFVENTPPGAIVTKVNHGDNPWFPEVLRAEMEHDRATNYDKYLWIWEGNPRGISNAQVFRGKYVVEDFEVPEGVKIYQGADWGYSQDPTVATQCHIVGRVLYISHETYGIGVEIDALPSLFDRLPNVRKMRIYADSARPETISYMKRSGFQIEPCRKWPGSVEDGIEFMRSFEQIVIHPRCHNTLQEFELYQYKQDRQTGEILPDIVDKNNHLIDSLRYSLQDYITKRGATIPRSNLRARIGI